jgi:hypothetical protein
MEWYQIIGIIMLWFVGLYLRGEFYEYLKNGYHNYRWRTRKKKK